MTCRQPAHHYKTAEQPHASIPNQLDRQFAIELNKVSAGETTYVRTGKRRAALDHSA